MDRLLRAAVDKISGADPNFQLDVVVIPERSASLAALRQHIERQGGEVTEANPDAVCGRVPIGQVRQLVDSDLISSIRLARSHRAHKK